MPLVELPKQCHPDFITPGKKPVGPVVLDDKHPLYKHLWIATLLPNPSGARRWWDYTKKVLWENKRGYDNKWVDGNLALESPGGPNTGNIYCADTISAGSQRAWLSTEPWSILWRGQSTLNTDSGLLLGRANYTTDYIYLDDTFDLTFINSAGDFTGFSAFTDGWSKNFSYCVTTDGLGDTASNMNAHQDGVWDTTQTGETSTLWIDTLLGSYQRGASTYEGTIDYIYMLDIELDREMAISMYLDPFQIYKPAVPLYAFMPDDAVAGFEAQWARNSNTIIQVVV